MTSPTKFFNALTLGLLLIVCPLTSGTQTVETTSTAATTESVSSLRSEIERSLAGVEQTKAADPEAEAPATAAELLNQAAEKLQQREQSTSQTEEHRRAVRESPAMLEHVRMELQTDLETSATAGELLTTGTAEMLTQQLDTARAELQSLEQSLAKINDEQQRRITRLSEIPRELVQARQNLNQAEIAAQTQAIDDEPAVAQARNLLARADVLAARARITELEEELNRYNSRDELLPQARQLVSQRIANKQSLLEKLDNRVAEMRRKEATASAHELSRAAREANRSHPLVRSVASENTSITREMDLGAVVEAQEHAANKLTQVQQTLSRVTEQFTSLKTKFDAVGFSDALGILLRKQRKELPNLRDHREALQVLENRLAEVNLRSLEVQDNLSDLASPMEEAAQMVAKSSFDNSTSSPQEVQNEIVALLQARQEYLRKLQAANDNLFQTLIDLNTAEEELVAETASFQEFIDQRILWLPSDDRISVRALQVAGTYFKSLIQPSLWRDYYRSLVEWARFAPVAFLFTLVFLIMVFGFHRRWKLSLKANLEAGSRNRLIAFKPVAMALMYVALYALPVPAVLLAIGLPLANSLSVPVQVSSLATGFVFGAISLFLLQFIRTVIRRYGIASTYFSWPESSLLKLRRAFAPIVWVYVPAIIVVRAADAHGTDASTEASRLTLVLALIVASLVIGWLLLPRISVLAPTQLYKSSTFLRKLRYFVFVLATGVPVSLAVAALLGYVYTAIELSQRLHLTFWVGTFLLLFKETIFFWILVKRRRLALEEARRRREAARAALEGEGQSQSHISVDGTAPPEPNLDIAAISQQAGRLLRVFTLGVFVVALWGVWAGVLPALRYLDSQPLWSVSRQVTETLPDGAIQSVDRVMPVTVADMLLVSLIIFAAVVALRNIPGLLDITVFQRFSVQAGERYAFNTLIRYVIIIIGIVYVAYLLGLQWKQIQWLAAAVSVGLGFGLQEIFANFVSGLILLFERPVRVGDFVHVGNIKGNITQIRIRATTVRDWDHFEHIIPNKEMITKPVENWTLSDLKRRLVIHVGVPYGCDYDQARDILLNVAQENPYVLKDPAPAAGIESLGDSSVLMVVFAHLPNSDDFLAARHTLIAGFERQLSAVGIPIPFPQLDVHMERPGK